MPKSRPKEEELEPISHERSIERYLRYTMDLHEIISCYFEEADLRFTGYTESVEREGKKLRFQLEVDTKSLSPTDLKRKITLAVERKIKLSFFTHDVLFFASAILKGASGVHITLELDGPIYKLQRRSALRMKLTEDSDCRITIKDKKYIPHDVSALGISVMFSLTEENLFTRKQIIPAALIEFGGKSAIVDLTVISKNRMKHHRTELVKVGFRFEKLPTSLEQSIAKEAYLYTHRVFGRRI